MLARAKWRPFVQSPQAAAEASEPLPIPVFSADAKKFGLENFGNTCYANSVIQALYFCTPFRDLLIQATDPSLIDEPIEPSPLAPVLAPVRRKPERKPSTSGDANGVVIHPPIPGIPSSPPSLFSALRSLFVYISTNPAEKGTVAPRAFIDKLKEFNELFRSTMHQDAHEFLNYLLNKIVEEIEEDRKSAESGTATPQLGEDLSLSSATLASKDAPTGGNSSGTTPQNATLVHKLFEGILTSETRCLTCENVSSRDESFLDLSIDIEQNASVTACLRQFSASEMLCQKNKFFCDVCCDLQEAEKRMKIKKLPNVLALHLKRFKYQEDVQKYIKLAYRVAFPFELRLFNTVDDIDDADRLFNLFGIVVHIGNGPHHGHYISIIKTMGLWLVFDDDNVYPITEADIPKYFGESNSGSAYVLYYQAVDIDLPSLGLQPRPASVPVEQVEIVSHVEAPPSPALNPPLPPGLIEEADLSDTSEPAFPITPHSPPDTRQPIDIITPAHVEEPAPASSPTKGNKMFGLRRTPSTSTRPSTSGAADTRQSSGVSPSLNSDPLIPTPAVPPLPPPPLAHLVTSNGKEKEKRKEPERKASGWFGKRKSFRLGDKTRPDSGATDEVPTSPVLSTRPADTVSQASSSTWFLTSGHNQDKKGRRPSEPGLFDSARGSKTISAAATRPKSTGRGLTVKPERDDGMNGYDSPSPGSASSSFVSVAGSGSLSAAQQSVVDFPPARTSSLAPQQPQPPPPPLPAPPQPPTKPSLHKKSMSNLSSPKDKKAKARGPPSVDPPPRPSTAGPVPGAADVSPPRPLPPVPPLTVATSAPLANGGDLFRGGPLDSLDKGRTRSKDGNGETDENPLDLPSSPIGLGSFAGANNSASSTSSSNGSANPKRATRKMSLTSPLMGLGFGKRDKHKDKEKSPSSFHFGSTGKV
ncbi:hypothetical protein DFH07DRAFT_822500 [Mycena maculata]|uniref:Ubiquitin carboxyl-terminal hydrolase n=1 Tax=Mycena maculata TaxID=230809 RepID=A0AAD7NDA5_9AGAR|nr:hypothetical protein DFH07DRAFT_822500 [Mycena maculata]